MNQSYCVSCSRQFGSEKALQMHFENAKIHKGKAIKRKGRAEPQNVVLATLPSHSTIPLTLSPPAQNFGLGYIAPIPKFGVEGSSMTTGFVTTIPWQTSSSLQYQPQNGGFSVAELATHLPAYPPIRQLTNRAEGKIKHGNNYWSRIPEFQYASTFERLSEQCHSSDDLLKNRYTISPYDLDAIYALRKCKNCHGLQKNIQSRAEAGCAFHTGSLQIQDTSTGLKLYSCCGRSGRGCTSSPFHEYGNLDQRLLTKHRELAPTPPGLSQVPKRWAVALDCEMVGVEGGCSELALLCAVDFFSGETLVNTLVEPTGRVISWRTRYSGVTKQAMNAAKIRGDTLNGWRAARGALWEHIDADTILVGQSLQYDLDVLRMIHVRVVDSGILARNAVNPHGGRQWGLRTLCQELLDIGIQNSKKGHDCLEDTLAAREIVLWCIQRPQELADWGLVKKKEEEQRQKEQLEKAQKKEEEQRQKEQLENSRKTEALKKAQKKIKKGTAMPKQVMGIKKEDNYFDDDSDEDEDEDEDGDEVMYWSDIAEACGWPHPNTGYDPWSD